jgi:hypothetical protein
VVAELARQGRPFPEKTRIEYLVMIGVDPSRSPIVRNLVACLPGVHVVRVPTLREAVVTGMEVAKELAARTVTPAAAPPVGGLDQTPPGIAAPGTARQPVRVELKLDFPPQTMRFRDDIQRSNLTLQGWSYAGRMRSKDVTGDTVLLEAVPGPLKLDLQHDGQTIEQWSERIPAGNQAQVTRTLSAARIVVEGDQLLAGGGVEWSVTDQATGQDQSRPDGPELLLPPGRYHIEARLGTRQTRDDVTVGFGETRVLRLPPADVPVPRPPAEGILVVQTQIQHPLPDAGHGGADDIEIQVRGPSSQRTSGPEATLQRLRPGAYSVTAHMAGRDESASQVVVEPGQTTRVRMLFGPARLKLDLNGPAERVVWRVTRLDTREQLERRGKVADLALPSAHYRVQVWADEGEAEVPDLELHDYVRRTLSLKSYER